VRLFKSWTYRIVGAIFLVWGFLCLVNDAMDWDFIAPGGILGTMMMLGGGFLLAKGLTMSDEPGE
jgi:hypothetical protein